MMRFIILSVMLCAVASAAPSDKVDCDKIEEVIDDMGGAQGITTLNDNYKLTTTSEELTKRCQLMKDAIKTLRKYNSECNKALTQQVFSAILRTRSQFNDAHCVPDSAEFKDSVEAVKCISEKALDVVKEAETKAIVSAQVLYEANVTDDKLRLRRACCNVLGVRDGFINAAKSKCPSYEKLYTEYVDSYTSEAMGLICPDTEKLDCGKLEAIKTDGVQPKNKLFLNPMLKVVKTLDH